MSGGLFIQPYIAGVQQAVNVPLYDPRFERAGRERFRRPAIPELAYANTLMVPAGRWPAKGWILLRRGDYNQISNLYAINFQLQIQDTFSTRTAITFQNLAIVQARCVSRGSAADPNAVYLVELTDLQGVLWNPWAQFPKTNGQYNVGAPAYPGQFYSSTLNAGSPWTWDTMIGDLWGQMSAFLGPYPHLPITPAATPENWIFTGVSAWESMNSVLDYLGLTQSEDLTQVNPYGIVVPGAADPVFAALQAKYAGLIEDDLEYIDAGSGRIPGQVVVYFHRRNQYYGTEETVRNDALQWQSTPLYSVTVPAPALFAQAQGTHSIWADFTIRYDVNNIPLPADVAMAQTVATERVTQYYTRAYRGTLGYSRRVYAGALPFYAGSQVDGVRWYQDYARGRFGWCTELITGPLPPWPEVEVEGQVYRG